MNTYFPNEIFKNIVDYCANINKINHKKKWILINRDIKQLVKDCWYYDRVYNEAEDADGNRLSESNSYQKMLRTDWNFHKNTTIKFCFSDRTNTHDEIGMGWLVRQFIEDSTCWYDWTYFS